MIKTTRTQSNPDGSETTYIERKVKQHKEITEKLPSAKAPCSHIPVRSVDRVPCTPGPNFHDNLSQTSMTPTRNTPRYPPDVPHPKQITLPENIPTPSKFYVITAGQEIRIFFDWYVQVL